MPSQTLKDALAGNETAFIQMLWNIENQKIEAKDLIYFTKTLDKNTYGRSLTAALYIFGGPGVEVNTKKAEEVINSIISENNFSFAYFIKYKLYESKVHKLIEEAVVENRNNKHIPTLSRIFTDLAIRSLDFNNFQKKLDDILLEAKENKSTNSLISLLNLNRMLGFGKADANEIYILSFSEFHMLLKSLPYTHKELQQTNYIKDLNSFVAYLEYKIPEIYSKYQSSYDFDNRNNLLESNRATPREFIIDLWLTLADYHRNTGHRTLMFNAFQQAIELDPKKEKKLINELGGKKLEFNDIEKYLNSFIKIAKVILPKIPSASPEQLKIVLFKQNIEFKNCKLLADYFSNKFPLDQTNEINKLLNKCNILKETIERDVNLRLPKTPSTEDRKSLK